MEIYPERFVDLYEAYNANNGLRGNIQGIRFENQYRQKFIYFVSVYFDSHQHNTFTKLCSEIMSIQAKIKLSTDSVV